MDEKGIMRELYEDKLKNLNIKEKGNKIAFADELCGCRILVYKDTLPSDMMKALTPAYIIVAGEFIGIKAFKCAFIEDKHAFAFSYKRFPEFWSIFRRCFDDVKMAYEYIDLSLLNTETRKAELKGGKIEFSSKVTCDSNISKLQSLRDNPNVLFILDKRTNTLHDKSCEELNTIPFEYLEVFQGYLFEEYKYCKNCRDRFHIRLACGDDFKHFSTYKRFLSDGGLSEVDIEYYIRQRDFNMRFAGPDLLQIKSNEDTWQIKKNSERSYTLMHNNYAVTDSGERMIGKPSNYHIQCHGKSLMKLFDRLCFYSYEKHLEAAAMTY